MLCERIHGRSSSRFLLVVACTAAAAAAAAAESVPTFEEHVLPIFREKCCSCHNPDKKKGGLDLTSHGQSLAGGSSGEVIAAGDPDGSHLWLVISHASEPKMPPESDKLPAESLDVIRRWIAGGAIDRAGGAPVARKQSAIVAATGPIAGPAGPPVMPPRLPLEVVFEAPRPTTITALAASPHGDVVAVGGRKQVVLHHAGSLGMLGVLPFPEGVVKTLRFTRNGKLLVAGGGEAAKSGRVVVWDVASGTRVAELGEEYDEVLAADLSPDQRLVALGGQARVVRLLDAADGSVDSELRKHTDWVMAAEFSPRGDLIATGDRAGNLFLWEPVGGREHGTLKGHTGAITGMAWRADGAILATASADGSIRLWNPGDASQAKNWQAHGGGVESICWLRDGRLVSTGRDRRVKFWSPEGKLERETAALADIGTRVTVNADASRVFAGDWSGAVTVWNVADAAVLGSLDTNPPRLEKRLEAAEKSLAEVASVGTAAAEKIREAAEALQVAESQMATARKAMEEAEHEAAAAKARQADAAKDVDHWREEIEFSRAAAKAK